MHPEVNPNVEEGVVDSYAEQILDISRNVRYVQVSVAEFNRSAHTTEPEIDASPRARAAAERIRKYCSIPDHIPFADARRTRYQTLYSFGKP